MIFLEIRLARHGACSALVANDGLRGYNIATNKMPNNDEHGYAKIVCTERDFDLTKAEFKYPIMVNKEIAVGDFRIV